MSCGCIACARCVRAHFEGQLATRIEEYMPSSKARRISVPSNSLQLGLLRRRLAEAGQNPNHLFSYSCPCCEALVKRAPVINQELGAAIDLFVASAPALANARTQRSPRSPRSKRDLFFAGLFLDTQ